MTFKIIVKIIQPGCEDVVFEENARPLPEALRLANKYSTNAASYGSKAECQLVQVTS